jgi:hypothetical protein
LALGIGINVAIFSFVDVALIKPLPYRDQFRLVSVFETNAMGSQYSVSVSRVSRFFARWMHSPSTAVLH